MVTRLRFLGKIWIATCLIFLLIYGFYYKNTEYGSTVKFINEDSNTDCKLENYIFGQPIKQTDPCLVSTFKRKMLIPPPPSWEQNHEEWNISEEIPSNIEKFKWIEKLLIEKMPEDSKSKGFFIECGANDGYYISSTIHLERAYNWTGLLIEANPAPFKTLLTRKRNAYLVNAALCTTEKPQPLVFHTYPIWPGASGLGTNKNYGESVDVTVPCIPFFTILTALELETVEYLNLDVEGFELAILETLPFDKIKFKVMTIEYKHIPGKSKALRGFLEKKGYKFVTDIKDNRTVDSLYVHKSLYKLAVYIKKNM